MLDGAIENYVDSLTEREFDAPFLALLRLNGFTDIHFLHGAFEFGKDFIAKRTESGEQYKYAFQTKAGDIGISEWNACRGQIDMLRTNALAHPNFDKTLVRRALLVTTGRLVGGGALAAQEYGNHLKSLGEAEFLTWDKHTLVEKLAVAPGSLCGAPPALLQILGSQGDSLNFSGLEKHSRTWIRDTPDSLSLRDVLEASVIANHCRLENRIDLACYTSLMLVRSSWATAHGRTPLPETAELAIATGKRLFQHYAKQLWNLCSGKFLEPDAILRLGTPPAGYVTYPVRCLVVAELLSMLALLERAEDAALSQQIVHYLSVFLAVNVGGAHPISDRWGISVVCAALELHSAGKLQELDSYARSVIKWVADHYDQENLGLAGPHAEPAEETKYLLGSRFEHVAVSLRRESYVATLVLDLCAVLELKELFELARNEFLAVGICLPVLEFDDTVSQYSVAASGQRYEPNMPYEEAWKPIEGWKLAPHHRRGPDTFYPESKGGFWDQMAISCVTRDRHFVQSWHRFAESIHKA